MVLYFTGLLLAIGMAAQALALRFGLPGIVVLLVAGVAFGPDVLGVVDPAALGSGRADLVSLAVAIILFEGGLGLQIDRLRAQQRSLLLLLTVGGAISMLAGTLAARLLLDMPWSTAALYGSLMIVTGPTVVTPLLARLTVDRSVRDLLVSEGVLIDPVGAIVAILAAEYVVQQHEALVSGGLAVWQLLAGGAIGAVAGVAMAAVLRRRWVHPDLWNPTVLASVIFFTVLAEHYVGGEAGLMTAVIQGVWMANTGLRELGRLRQFNEEVTVLLLSFLFVMLAANLPLAAVRDLGWRALAVVAVLIWVARPLAVAVCTAGSDLTWAQRAFVAWVCPRGIVAASVAGLFGILLRQANIEGGSQLEALVFVTVGITVTLQGLTIGPVAHILGVDVPQLRGTIIIGAEQFGRLLARLLVLFERQVVLIDRNPYLCRRAATEGLLAYTADALSEDALENAGARYVDAVLAATANSSLNTLIAQRVKQEFHAQRVLAIEEDTLRASAENPRYPFPGNLPNLHELNRRIGMESVLVQSYHVDDGSPTVGQRLDEIEFGSDEFALLLLRRDRVFIASAEQVLEAGDRVLCIAPRDAALPPPPGLTRRHSVTPGALTPLLDTADGGNQEPAERA